MSRRVAELNQQIASQCGAMLAAGSLDLATRRQTLISNQ